MRGGGRRREGVYLFDGLRGYSLCEEAQSVDQLSAVMSLAACTMTSSVLRRGAQQRDAQGTSFAIQWRPLSYRSCISARGFSPKLFFLFLFR